MVAAIESVALPLPLCPGCNKPAHAAETDDNDFHPECLQTLALLWNLVDDDWKPGRILLDVRWRAVEGDDLSRVVNRTIVSLSVETSQCDRHAQAFDLVVESGPLLDDVANDLLVDEVEAWAARNGRRSPVSYAPRIEGPLRVHSESKVWESARAIVRRLEAERDKRDAARAEVR
jgi:hypothetical protein